MWHLKLLTPAEKNWAARFLFLFLFFSLKIGNHNLKSRGSSDALGGILILHLSLVIMFCLIYTLYLLVYVIYILLMLKNSVLSTCKYSAQCICIWSTASTSIHINIQTKRIPSSRFPPLIPFSSAHTETLKPFTHLPHWLIHHSCLSTHPGAFTCTRMLDVWCWIGQTVVSHPASGCITGKSWQGKLSDCDVVKGVVSVFFYNAPRFRS